LRSSRWWECICTLYTRRVTWGVRTGTAPRHPRGAVPPARRAHAQCTFLNGARQTLMHQTQR
jgi:hypothetical protein